MLYDDNDNKSTSHTQKKKKKSIETEHKGNQNLAHFAGALEPWQVAR